MKFSNSLENFKILKFFNLWALKVLERRYSQILGKFEYMFLQTQPGKIWSIVFWGCGLPNSAAILRRPLPHVVFCLKKSMFGPQEVQKFGFCQDGMFERSQHASEVLLVFAA